MVNLNMDQNFKPNSAVVLGSTGSVGRQTLEVINDLGLSVECLAAGENTSLLAEQIKVFRPKFVAVANKDAYLRLKDLLGKDAPEIVWKTDEAYDLIRTTSADIIFHSVAGLNGLGYALAAAKSGKRIGMANKEAIIAAGNMIFNEINNSGGDLIPVDSEHCAVYRCLMGKSISDVRSIQLTASGGPFFGKSADTLKNITPEEALCHPTWKMGKKITIDSATLMNKGFEIIEAVRLFGVPEDRVSVVVHRQSIVHSMVEFNDRTLLAQLGKPDMRDCIRFAATAPNCSDTKDDPLDLCSISALTFERPDTEVFPLLDAARSAVRTGGTAPVSLIAADEEAVAAYLDRKISFFDISSYVIETLSKIQVFNEVDMDTISQADMEARQTFRNIIQRK